jgi:hypothetical protein
MVPPPLTISTVAIPVPMAALEQPSTTQFSRYVGTATAPVKRRSVSIDCVQAASAVRAAPTATRASVQGDRWRRRNQSG